jgi:predicted DNA-binding transcriptional regulator AlpA
MNSDLAKIIANPESFADIPREKIPALLVQIAAVQSALAALLTDAPLKPKEHPLNSEPDALLTAEQAAKLLSVTPHWLYRHWKQLPFSRRLSRKTLRFSESGIRKWQNTKKA